MQKSLEGLIHSEYNEEPVYYCKNCLSLSIRGFNDLLSYCDNCGNTQIELTDIFTWENLYKRRYNKNYLDNGRE